MWKVLSFFRARKSGTSDGGAKTLNPNPAIHAMDARQDFGGAIEPNSYDDFDEADKRDFISIPIPPSNPKLVFKIESSWRNIVYHVDIPNQTCTCDDFVNNGHAGFVVGDIRRCCRHLLRAYKYERAKKIMSLMPEYNLIPEHVWAMIHNGHTAREIWIKNLFGHPVVFTKSKIDSVWLNVFIRTKKKGDSDIRSGEYECCGYSLVERRWAHKAGPEGACRAIRKVIEDM